MKTEKKEDPVATLLETAKGIRHQMLSAVKHQTKMCLEAGLVCKKPAKDAPAGPVSVAARTPQVSPEEELREVCLAFDTIINAARQTMVDIGCGIIA